MSVGGVGSGDWGAGSVGKRGSGTDTDGGGRHVCVVVCVDMHIHLNGTRMAT